MIEHKTINHQLLKNMIINLVLLTLIFGTFSIFILSQFNNYLYSSVDKEIFQFEDNLQKISELANNKYSGLFPKRSLTDEEIITEVQEHLNAIENPRIVTILRDKERRSNSNIIKRKILC